MSNETANMADAMSIEVLVANAASGSRARAIGRNQFVVESVLNCKGLIDRL